MHWYVLWFYLRDLSICEVNQSVDSTSRWNLYQCTPHKYDWSCIPSFFFVSLKKPQLLSIQITAGLSVIIESDYHCSDLFVVLHKTNLSSNSNLVPVSQVLFLPSSQSWRTGLWTSPCHKTWAYFCTQWLLLQLLSSNYGVVFVISSSFCCIQMFFVVMTWLWMLMALMNWAVAPSFCCS